MRNEGQHIQALHPLLAQEEERVALIFVHDGDQQVAQLHCIAARRTDMVERAFQHALHAVGLGDFILAGLVHHFQFRTEKTFQLLAQHSHAGPAALQNNPAFHAVGQGVEHMFHCQQIMPAPLHFHKGVPQDALHAFTQHIFSLPPQPKSTAGSCSGGPATCRAKLRRSGPPRRCRAGGKDDQ